MLTPFEHLFPSSSQLDLGNRLQLLKISACFQVSLQFFGQFLDRLFVQNCNKLFVGDGSADLEVSKWLKKQTHSLVLRRCYTRQFLLQLVSQFFLRHKLRVAIQVA